MNTKVKGLPLMSWIAKIYENLSGTTLIIASKLYSTKHRII